MTTRVVVDRSDVDLLSTVLSGQAFRWRAESDVIRGVDGEHWYVARRTTVGWSIESNADQAEIRRLFGLEDDLDELTRVILSKSGDLMGELTPHFGIRVMAFHDPVEVVFSFLCSSNSNIPRISKMVHALADRGDPLPAPFPARRFPGIARLAQLEVDELWSEGFGYRAKTIPLAARELFKRGGEAYLSDLKSAGYARARDELISLPGVGPKLADCICLFGLHYRQAVPIDTHIWRAALHHFRPEWKGKAVTSRRYQEIGDMFRERFGDHAGWVQQLLFFSSLRSAAGNHAGPERVPLTSSPDS